MINWQVTKTVFEDKPGTLVDEIFIRTIWGYIQSMHIIHEQSGKRAVKKGITHGRLDFDDCLAGIGMWETRYFGGIWSKVAFTENFYTKYN